VPSVVFTTVPPSSDLEVKAVGASETLVTTYRHTSEILRIRFQITAIERVTRIFLFPSTYKIYVYTIL
jgi:hypothetical protein